MRPLPRWNLFVGFLAGSPLAVAGRATRASTAPRRSGGAWRHRRVGGDMAAITPNLVVFVAVVVARLAIPLAIPRFPLPAILACLIIDGVDQTLFQRFTTLDLTDYQSYDKALDIYYLSIAYLATMRNWWNLPAFKTSRFLYFYRLVGVVIFELSQLRLVLMIFPNTFEYFFIFYEAVRTRWDPRRLGRRLVLIAAAAIWIAIKLPQEYWIHVAQLDATDTMQAYPLATALLAAVAAVLAWVAWRVGWPLTPPADWRWSVDADAQGAAVSEEAIARTRRQLRGRFFDEQLFEKIAMVALIVVIFGRILPGVRASDLQLALGVAVLIVVNTAVSELLARRGATWRTIATEFLAMAAVNGGVVVVFSLLLRSGEGRLHVGNTLFFVLLLTLIVTLYDRFRPISIARFGEGQSLRAGL